MEEDERKPYDFKSESDRAHFDSNLTVYESELGWGPAGRIHPPPPCPLPLGVCAAIRNPPLLQASQSHVELPAFFLVAWRWG